uniref:inorganic diphosphatase n=1 Tax=Prymnesium polylepis TaxID=72548 RepID=A0A7S4HGP8_9EUKA
MVALAALLVLPLVAAASVNSVAVFGHKIPDTDAICAAVVYAWELESRGIPATAYRLGELNPETEYVLRTLDVKLPALLEEVGSGDTVAIVDTNNPAELLDGVEKADVHSIVDHHKLCGLKTSKPLAMDIRPLCSTGSILYARAKAAGRKVPKKIAALMLSCILSDSLEFRSPTTTEADKQYAAELAKIARIDMHAHAEAMLDAKAEVGHLSPAELVMMDSKVFEIGGKKLRVSVIETTKPGKVLQQEKALQEAMGTLRAEQKLDDVLLFVVDILHERAVFVSSSASASATVERAWAVSVGADGTATLPGVLSRKKQIVPALESAAAGGQPIELSSPVVEEEPPPPQRARFMQRMRVGAR